MSSREHLVRMVKIAEEALAAARMDLEKFDRSPEQWVYSDIEEASGWLEEELYNRAAQDCEGSHNCGDSEYRQKFFLNGELHVAILYDIQYNRHDKTYYFVDECQFKIEECSE